MTKPQRIQLKRTKGWRLPENTVSVARPHKWGNPFKVGAVMPLKTQLPWQEPMRHSNESAVHWFRDLLACDFTDDTPSEVQEYIRGHYPSKEKIISELRGKNLACWCKPDQPCHADVLLEIANQ